ncbi:Replication-associated protein G2P [Aggregatibacter actinomycetemcomitans serotype e str. SC936]|uniref:phage/plasmid replication domain-containing protein n=1 Tax=Aggregatibacter actinomycetemcomitans TaxID=714 RepID=UPI00077E5139|nr:phage/plasmid replication protein [Aggregatibacter actinomycetemcomitans]KYK81133.1 Replication-associated protein G2P [Aggregatibacter actinomycetemcomitans serotype e str. SC936]
MFFDWLKIEQDFNYQLPLIGDFGYVGIHIDTGEQQEGIRIPAFKHEGSFCDSVIIKINGSVLTMSGNPSRWGRTENLFGLSTVEACVNCFNSILENLGLPAFTKCTQVFYGQSEDGTKVKKFSDGAIIKELHITENRAVGRNNVEHYLSGLSTLNYRNSVARLHTNGETVDWLSKLGNANLIYPSVYNKAYELELHSLNKIKNKFGEQSSEYKHLLKVIDFCKQNGVARFEQKLKSRYLQKENLNFYGLSDYSRLKKLSDEFINIDEKLKVTAMDFETISETLLNNGVVDTVRSANTTAMYALQWSHGQVFDLSKAHIKRHRAKLRKIGIDIGRKCDLSKFSPVKVVLTREINVSNLIMPNWYKLPNYHLKLAA